MRSPLYTRPITCLDLPTSVTMKEQVKKKPKGRGKVGLASACRLAEASRATRPVVCHPWASPARQRQKKRKRSTSPEGTQAASSFADFRAFSSGSAPSAASESAPTGSPASGPDASPLLCTTIRKSLSRLCGDSCSVRIFRFRPPLGPPSARFLLSQQRRLLRRMLHIHATPPCNAAQLSRAAACGSSRESATENKSLATKGITQRATRGGLAAVNAPDAPLPKSSSAATPSPSSCGSLCRWCDTTRFSCPPMLHLPCWKSAFRVEEGDSECEEETHSQTLDPDGMQSPTQEGRRAGAGEASAESRFRDRISGDHALAPPDLFSSFQSRHVLYVHPQVVLKENPETGCSLFLRGDVQHGTLLMAARSLVCSWVSDAKELKRKGKSRPEIDMRRLPQVVPEEAPR
ncbi:hypothetical protein BESB_017170 [Besnoitia besnoiti]|uniref:Uncharacterized protein n=1 Tax=Besnoitia besnoiti TaxID=94643 RepID=A0A2A9M385_BESBE|nr:hypothetical protein BESB_017170 [Besnoitia besnoiti]PFH32399.1 hypothetical protein BESB_017170 [Besnoitia besnoiti]